MTLVEKQEKRAKLITDAKAILDKADAEKRELTAEETTQYDNYNKEIDSLKLDVERRTRIDALEVESRQSAGRQVTPSKPGENSLGMPEKDLSKFSVLRCIQLTLDNKRLDGIEGEVEQEMERRYNKRTRSGVLGGFRIPLDLPMVQRRNAGGIERRAVDTTTGAGGVNSTVMYSQLIDLLRNRSVVQVAGARLLTDLVGNVAIPRVSGSGSSYWVTEGSPSTGSNATLDSVSLAPKTIGAYTDITRKFALQTSMDAEALVRDDLTKVLGLGIDLAALNGSGAGAIPLGILQNSSVASVDFGGVDPTWPKVVSLESAVATANADIGKLGYITNPPVRGKLKTIPKFTNTGFPIWENGNIVNGYNAYATNQISGSLSNNPEPTAGALSAMIFGNWDDLIIAMWGGLDILIDPYTGSNSGTVRLTCFQDCDIKLRHNASFAKGYNIKDD